MGAVRKVGKSHRVVVVFVLMLQERMRYTNFQSKRGVHTIAPLHFKVAYSNLGEIKVNRRSEDGGMIRSQTSVWTYRVDLQ